MRAVYLTKPKSPCCKIIATVTYLQSKRSRHQYSSYISHRILYVLQIVSQRKQTWRKLFSSILIKPHVECFVTKWHHYILCWVFCHKVASLYFTKHQGISVTDKLTFALRVTYIGEIIARHKVTKYS